jgi:hypothetical protein
MPDLFDFTFISKLRHYKTHKSACELAENLSHMATTQIESDLYIATLENMEAELDLRKHFFPKEVLS